MGEANDAYNVAQDGETRLRPGSILITTNKSARDWTELLARDEVLATAILDRLLHKAHVLNIQGRSYRPRDFEQSPSLQRQRLLPRSRNS